MLFFRKKQSTASLIFIINTFFFFFFFFLFSIFPELDIKVAKLFFFDGVFLSEKYEIIKFVRTFLKNIMILIPVISIIYLLFVYINKKQNIIITKKYKKLRNILVSIGFLIGPIVGCGIIANLYFKDTWGRARPVNIEEFGGTKIYTPPFIKSDQCKKNCSWIGGESAAAFSFLVGVVILKSSTKLIYANILFGLTVSLFRMLMGGHFLSDNLFSAFFMIYLALIYKTGILFILKKKNILKNLITLNVNK
tara:strand:- start:1645 stop:2394 length:750 start_codon:yes stop_codon:yes gene_type:complete